MFCFVKKKRQCQTTQTGVQAADRNPAAIPASQFAGPEAKTQLVTPQPPVTKKKAEQPDWADEGGIKLEQGMIALSSAVTSDPSDGDIYKMVESWTTAVLKPANKHVDGCLRT